MNLGSSKYIVLHKNCIRVLSLILTSIKHFLTSTSILTRVAATDFLFATLVLSEESVSLRALVCPHSLPVKVQSLQTALKAWRVGIRVGVGKHQDPMGLTQPARLLQVSGDGVYVVHGEPQVSSFDLQGDVVPLAISHQLSPQMQDARMQIPTAVLELELLLHQLHRG